MPPPPAAPPAAPAVRSLRATPDPAPREATPVVRRSRTGRPRPTRPRPTPPRPTRRRRLRLGPGRTGRRLLAAAVAGGALLTLAVPAVRAAALPTALPGPAAATPTFPAPCTPDVGGPGGCQPGPVPSLPGPGLPVPSTTTSPTPPTTGPSAPTTELPGASRPPTPRPTAPAPTPLPTPTTPLPTTVEPPQVDQPGGVTGWIARGISSAISGFFRGLVTSALNPLLDLLGRTLLSTPTLDQLPRVGQLWESGRQFTVAAYVLLVIIGGITVMAHETVQTRYSIKEIGPRIVVGFLAANLSLLLSGKAIAFANAASAAALGDGVNPESAAGTLTNLVAASLRTDSGLFLVFLGLALAGLLVALLVGYVVRVALTVALIAAAAPALACFATPFTEPVARWWCRAFAGVLAIQIGQSIALAAAVRVFFAPGGWTVFGPSTDGLVNLLVTLALIYILVKIPFWVLHQVQAGGGRSFVGSLVRGFLAYKAFGLVRGGSRRGTGGGAGGGAGNGGGRRPPRPGPRAPLAQRPRPRPAGPGAGRGGVDPYERVRADRTGQTLLPLAGLRRVARPASRTASGPAAGPRPAGPLSGSQRPGSRPRAAAGGQLRLPADGTWPEQRPVLLPDGQYRLPIPVTRVRRPTPAVPAAPPGAARTRSRAGRGRQLEIPFDPYDRLRPRRGGQYPLPLAGLARVPRPIPPATAAPPAPASAGSVLAGRRAARGRQLALPLDLPAQAAPSRAAPSRAAPLRTVPPRPPGAAALPVRNQSRRVGGGEPR